MQKRCMKEQASAVGTGSQEGSQSQCSQKRIDDAELYLESEFIRLFRNLSLQSRQDTIGSLKRKAHKEKDARHSTEFLETVNRQRDYDCKIVHEWKDDEGVTSQIVEANEGLTAEQRLEAVADILAGIALRMMKKAQ